MNNYDINDISESYDLYFVAIHNFIEYEIKTTIHTKRTHTHTHTLNRYNKRSLKIGAAKL